MAKKKKTGAPVDDSGRRGFEYYQLIKLEEYRQIYSAGNEAGLFDALCFCREYPCPLPKWALDAVIDRQQEILFGDNKRTKRWQRQYRQDMADYVRAELIQELRDRGTPWREVYKLAAHMLNGEGACGPNAMKDGRDRYNRISKNSPERYYLPRYIKPPERKTLIGTWSQIFDEENTLDASERAWLDKHFPIPAGGGPRRYKRS